MWRWVLAALTRKKLLFWIGVRMFVFGNVGIDKSIIFTYIFCAINVPWLNWFLSGDIGVRKSSSSYFVVRSSLFPFLAAWSCHFVLAGFAIGSILWTLLHIFKPFQFPPCLRNIFFSFALSLLKLNDHCPLLPCGFLAYKLLHCFVDSLAFPRGFRSSVNLKLSSLCLW